MNTYHESELPHPKGKTSQPPPPLWIDLPNHKGVQTLGILCLVFGIISIFTFIWPVPFTFGIIALVLGTKARKLHEAEPDAYREESVAKVNRGRKLAIVGMILSGVSLMITLFFFVLFFLFGIEAGMAPFMYTLF